MPGSADPGKGHISTLLHQAARAIGSTGPSTNDAPIFPPRRPW
ncbi:hypothetical protein ABZ883_18700 [Streptomyces sp. NPDC046977]